MANVQEAVRRLTVEATSRGLTETTDKLKQLQAAQQGVTVTSQNQERATQSMEKRLESIQRRYDQNYRAQSDLSRLERDLTAARNQGLITQTRQNELLQMATDRHGRAATAVGAHGVSLAGFATSMTRVLGALGLVVGVQQILSFAQNAVKTLGDVADEADRVGVSTAVLQTLQFELKQSGGAAEDAASGLARFGKASADAAAGGNYLSKIFQANGVALRDQNGQMRSSDALLQDYARLVANAGSQQEKLLLTSEAFGRAAGPKMVAMLERIAKDGLAGVVEQATKAGQVVEDSLIRKADEFDDAWVRVTDRITKKMKSFVVEVVDAGKEIAGTIGKIASAGMDSAVGQGMKAIYAPWTAGTKSGSSLLNSSTRAGQDEMDLFYGSTGAGRPGAAPTASNDNARRTTIPSRTESAYGRSEESIRNHIALMEAEGKAAGGSAGQLEKLRVQATLLEAAQQSGIPVTDELTKKIEALGNKAATAADSLAKARLRSDISFERDQLGRGEIDGNVAARLRGAGLPVDLASTEAGLLRVNEQLRLGKDLALDFASGFVRDIRSGTSALEALTNGLNRVADRLIDMALNSLVSKAFAGLTGGGGGVGLFSNGLGSAPIFGSANGNAFSGGNVIPFARGGVVNRPTLFPMANGAGLMGEAGPEAVMPLRRGADGKLGVSGGSPVVNVNVLNQSGGAEVEVSQPRKTANGGIDLDVIVRQVDASLAKGISNGSNATGRAIQGTYGARRVGQ